MKPLLLALACFSVEWLKPSTDPDYFFMRWRSRCELHRVELVLQFWSGGKRVAEDMLPLNFVTLGVRETRYTAPAEARVQGYDRVTVVRKREMFR